VWVFVSYRRDDVPDATDRLVEALKNRFGDDHVFIDIDNIEIGADFQDVIGDWVSRCDVLLAVIGHNWQARRAEGTPRIQDPDDYVRLEIEAALRRKVRVVPVLIHGAAMPTRNDLPESLVPLLRRNAKTLSRDHWRIDVDELVAAIGQIKESGTGLTAASPSRLSSFESKWSTATPDLASTTPPDESVEADPGAAARAATSEETLAGAGVAGAAKAPAGASDTAPAAPSSPARTSTAGSRRGLSGHRTAALAAGLVGVAAVVVVALVLVGALSSKPKASPKSRPTTSTPAAAAPTACGQNALSFCFPPTVNGGHAAPPLNPGELSGPQYSYRLVPGSLVSDPAAAALYGGSNALAGAYKAAGNTVDVMMTAFQSRAILQNAYAQYQSRLTDQGCKQYDSGTTSHNGQFDGDDVVFSCPGSTTPGQSSVFFIHDTTMATFTGPSASAVERFMVSWVGTGK
jgi:TIR domain